MTGSRDVRPVPAPCRVAVFLHQAGTTVRGEAGRVDTVALVQVMPPARRARVSGRGGNQAGRTGAGVAAAGCDTGLHGVTLRRPDPAKRDDPPPEFPRCGVLQPPRPFFRKCRSRNELFLCFRSDDISYAIRMNGMPFALKKPK
jgi:hypothetical protein